jgi:hypothetical protein
MPFVLYSVTVLQVQLAWTVITPMYNAFYVACRMGAQNVTMLLWTILFWSWLWKKRKLHQFLLVILNSFLKELMEVKAFLRICISLVCANERNPRLEQNLQTFCTWLVLVATTAWNYKWPLRETAMNHSFSCGMVTYIFHILLYLASWPEGEHF